MKPYYEDDFVQLHHGDCREVTAWLEADVLVTDPPYGMAFASRAAKNYGRREREGTLVRTISGDHNADLRDAIIAIWGAKPALIFGTWRIQRPEATKALLVWDKGDSPGMGDMTIPWGSNTEEVYVLGAWPPLHAGGRAREGGRPARTSSVIRAETLNSQAKDRPDHPTPKPVGLMERLIIKTPPGTIADPFAGSGSTLVAAKALGRKAIGVELEERYCEIAARRLAQDTLFGGGQS